ncbi:MAG: UDP-3-O-(3-hydroxymyristoyl)glucosamine N-acyltransferase [Planctomycetota bacterium]
MDLTLGELAESIGGRLTDESVATSRVKAIRSLGAATADDVSFYKGDPKYLAQTKDTRAAAIIVDTVLEGVTRPLIVVDDAAMSVSFLLAATQDLQNPPPPPGIHPTAVVDPTATLGADVTVGPFAVIEANARIGARSRIGAHCFVGRGTTLGEECLLHPGACVLHSCELGARVVLWSYAVVGRDGYGFLQRDGKHHRIPQVGGVRIGDEVEIGCWSSVDRGSVDPTVIEQGVKIDSQVHVAHNCFVGEYALLIGRSAMAGSAKLGKRGIIAQGGGIGNGRSAGDGAVIASFSQALYEDVEPGATVLGTPPRPFTRAKRIMASWDRLPELLGEVRDLRKRLAKLEDAAKKPAT